ncbi:MAG: alpha/beta hydrolase [Alcanivoracaceae bacterium]|nr:alpha/beta hydrolase [Alcanivoracaceae bacterium]
MTKKHQIKREDKRAHSWQGRAVDKLLRTFVKPAIAKVPINRRVMKFTQLGFDAVTLALPVHSEVHIAPADIGGVPGEWLMTGRNLIAGRVVLYFHGGAYFFGSPRSHRALTWRLSRACRAKVLALNYRQPPDWHFPAPLDDAVTAYKALLEQGYRPENIVFAGDSAGGNLALVTLLRLREMHLPLPSCAVLISPWGDLTCTGDTVASNAIADPLLPVNAIRFAAASYSAREDVRHPLISPVYADLTGLPPLLIQVGSTEVLLSDAQRIADNAERDGVQCCYQVWENMMHVFHVMAAWVPEAQHAVAEIGAFVEAGIAAAGGEKTARRRARLVAATKE